MVSRGQLEETNAAMLRMKLRAVYCGWCKDDGSVQEYIGTSNNETRQNE